MEPAIKLRAPDETTPVSVELDEAGTVTDLIALSQVPDGWQQKRDATQADGPLGSDQRE